MDNIFNSLVDNLKLGHLLRAPEQFRGGALHKTWHLVTDQGEYAAKEINQHIASKISFPQSYECSEEIAMTFSRQGISAVSAIRFHDHFVHKIQEKWFIVYPKVKGKIIPLNELTKAHALQIGKIFSRMHNLNFSINDVDKAHYDKFSDEYWENLINQMKVKDLVDLIPTIKKWNKLYNEAILILDKDLRITHRDLHHINVLWDDNIPWIIDWESAGLMNPTMEIVGYSLEWAGIIFNHSINELFLEELLNAYSESLDNQSIKTPINSAFYGWLGHCILGWTEFNLRRSLGIVSNDEDEILLGKKILESRMIPCLHYLKEKDKSLISMVSEKLIPSN